MIDNAEQRTIFIGTPAIGTPADRSRSVTPHTHKRIIHLQGELERSQQDRLEAESARQAMRQELDEARKHRQELEERLLQVQSQFQQLLQQNQETTQPPLPPPDSSPPTQNATSTEGTSGEAAELPGAALPPAVQAATSTAGVADTPREFQDFEIWSSPAPCLTPT